MYTVSCLIDEDTQRRYRQSNRQMGLPFVHELKHLRIDHRPLAIVGGGPSVKDKLDELRAWKGDIWAVNAAGRWLVENGVAIDAIVACDGDEILFDDLVPPLPVVHYLADVVHPKVVRAIKGNARIVLWPIQIEVEMDPTEEYEIAGGPTCILRAPILAYFMGRRNIHVFGVDSSFEGEPHLYAGRPGYEQVIQHEVEGRVFTTTPALLFQAEYLVELCKAWPNDVDFSVHGAGLALAMLERDLRPTEAN